MKVSFIHFLVVFNKYHLKTFLKSLVFIYILVLSQKQEILSLKKLGTQETKFCTCVFVRHSKFQCERFPKNNPQAEFPGNNPQVGFPENNSQAEHLTICQCSSTMSWSVWNWW